MKKLKVMIILLLIGVFVLGGCGDNTGDVNSSNSTTPNSQSNSTSSSSSISYDPIIVDPIEPSMSLSNLNDYQIIETMKELESLDGSYNGTDLSIGFPNAVERINDSFLTYPVGYGEGTTGGRGATVENKYYCSTGLQIIEALNSIKQKQSIDANLKSIIVVNSTITQDNSTSTELTADGKEPQKVFQIIIDSINNLSIVGEGNLGVFDGVGLNFKSSNNLIVQNLTIHHPSKILKNEKDCLEFNKCNYVWVDHNELYNDSPDNASEKDYYDGLCDVKNSSENVTISYNYLHDAFKTSLVGSGPDDLWENRRLSYHHNIFKNLNSRVPLIRSGYTHIYNNYYEDVNTGINLRIGAQGYVENNVFVRTKNPICSIEETKGFWNAKGNVYESCSGSGLNNQSSGSDFTPSYEYVLDDTTNLKTYLDKTVGVGKIDANVALNLPMAYELYKIPQDKIIAREIKELGDIKFDNATMQKLIYISDEISKDINVVHYLQDFEQFAGKCRQFLEQYIDDIEARIASVNTDGDFADNATIFYDANDDFLAMPKPLQNTFSLTAKKDEIESFYNENFVTKFNSEVASLKNAVASDLTVLNKLHKLSSRFKNLDLNGLSNAFRSCNNHIMVNDFSEKLATLPSATDLTYSSFGTVSELKNTYESFGSEQKVLITSQDESKYQAILSAYNTIIAGSLNMDLSEVSAGKVSGTFAQAGCFEIGVSTDVRDLSTAVSFGDESYNKCVFISGYGNAGSKCLKFNAYQTSDIVLVVANEKGNCRIKLTDPNKNEIDGVIASASGVQIITFKNVVAGEYRIYTDIPTTDGEFNGSSLFIYSASINPAK